MSHEKDNTELLGTDIYEKTLRSGRAYKDAMISSYEDGKQIIDDVPESWLDEMEYDED